MPNFTAARLRASEKAALRRSPESGCSLGEPTSDLVIHRPPSLTRKPAHDRAIGQDVVLVLPVLDAEYPIQPILNESCIDIGHRQATIVLHHLRLELHILRIERSGQSGRESLQLDIALGVPVRLIVRTRSDPPPMWATESSVPASSMGLRCQ